MGEAMTNPLYAEIEKLRALGKMAGEEIRHLRACIVDQADNRLEIDRLRAENAELNRKLVSAEKEIDRLVTYQNIKRDRVKEGG